MVDFPASGTGSDAVSRRTLIAAGVGLTGLALAGCSVEDPVADGKTPQPTAELTADVAVATRALSEITAARAAATKTMSRHPATRSGLLALVQMHRAHEESLADAVPDRASSTATPTPYAVPRKESAALKRLAAREQQLHDTLDGLAVRAQSGDFARLLASMGAGVGQRLAVWPA